MQKNYMNPQALGLPQWFMIPSGTGEKRHPIPTTLLHRAWHLPSRLWAAVLGVLVFLVPEFAADWPQYQHDARRSGFTTEEIHPPYNVAWQHCFLPERPARRTQAIVYQGSVYVGTQQGVMHCLDVATGKERWAFKGAGSIQHSCGCADGKVFFGSLDGCVYALDSKTGRLLWKRQTDAGFTVAPLLADGKVLMGNRRGTFFALDQATGRVVWKHKIDAPIFNTAATDNDRVFLGGEDIRVYALDIKTGKRLWVSDQLWGMSMKDYCPMVHKGYVIVRPMTSFEADLYTGRYRKGKSIKARGGWNCVPYPGGWYPDWGGFPLLYEEAKQERAGKMPQRLLKAQVPLI